MKSFLHFLRSRTGKNIIFWLLAAWFILNINPNANAYDKSVYLTYKLITTGLLLLMTCTNNFLLIPRTLAKKKFILFVGGVVVELLAFSVVYVLLLKQMINAYPKINVYDVSILTSPISPEYTTSAIVDDIGMFAFGLFIWVIVFTMAWYMNDHSRKVKEIEAAKQKQLEAELSILRNQLSPHFLFNTLNNIYGLALKKSDAAPESILKLSELMRYMLYESNEKTVFFSQEKTIIHAYINMELLRLQNADGITYNIESDRDYSLPPLLWLPVLENVFKHGTRMITDKYKVDFNFSIINNKLLISSSNTYKEGLATQEGGVGLSNLRKRLSILYPDKHSIVENKTNGTYSITVNVQLA